MWHCVKAVSENPISTPSGVIGEKKAANASCTFKSGGFITKHLYQFVCRVLEISCDQTSGFFLLYAAFHNL